MEEFEQMWKTAGNEQVSEQVDEDTPEYLIRDGMARIKILSDMLIVYYHAKYGEPLQEPPATGDLFDIEFHL